MKFFVSTAGNRCDMRRKRCWTVSVSEGYFNNDAVVNTARFSGTDELHLKYLFEIKAV